MKNILFQSCRCRWVRACCRRCCCGPPTRSPSRATPRPRARPPSGGGCPCPARRCWSSWPSWSRCPAPSSPPPPATPTSTRGPPATATSTTPGELGLAEAGHVTTVLTSDWSRRQRNTSNHYRDSRQQQAGGRAHQHIRRR